MYIGELRRKLFIEVDHEWNGVVRDITAKYETTGEMVDPEVVCLALQRFYKNRASLAMLRLALSVEHV